MSINLKKNSIKITFSTSVTLKIRREIVYFNFIQTVFIDWEIKN